MPWRRRAQRDFDDEIRSHLELETDRLVAEGMSPREARLAARKHFGNVGAVQERYHDASRLAWVDHLLKDVRYAARMLRKSPGFTTIAVVTLALGIGASTAVFSVVNGVLLRDLPYRQPDRLVKIWETLPGRPGIMVSYPDYKDWKARSRSFDDLAIYTPYGNKSFTGGDLPVRVGAGMGSANLFELLGVAPAAGRLFHPGDDIPGAEPVALLADGWWRRQFGADPAVVGRTIRLDGDSYRVVGVIPPTVGLGSVDVWLPIGPTAESSPYYARGNHPGLLGVGRLKPGVSLAQMNADLARVSSELRVEYPQDAAGIGAAGDFFREMLVANVRPALELMSWAVLFVLLIACVNVANLLLARATGRRKEISLRVAIGASDSRIVRLLITENLMLSLAGGALGVALAYGGLRAMLAMQQAAIPRLGTPRIDLPVLAFAAAVSVATGLIFGVLPARHASRVDLNDALKDSGRGTSVSAAALKLRSALMAFEVAMALMLLVGAGLLMRSFTRLMQVDPGVDPRGVATVSIDLPENRYTDAAHQRVAFDEVLRRVQALPGVASAALTSALPLGANFQQGFTFEGHPRPKGSEPLLNVQMVTPDYFSTVKMRVRAGRGIAATDVEDGERVVVIDESVAKKFFPGENPIGKHLLHGSFDSQEQPWTVVGIVNNVKDRSLAEPANGVAYMPFLQQPLSGMSLVVRSSLPADQVVPMLRREVAAFDKELPISQEAMLEDVIGRSVGQERFTMFVLGIFAVVALLLAAVGVYGVIAYYVAQRSHEIGIRLALGAQRSNIISLVTRRVLITTAVGIVAGLAAAIAASGLIRTLLYGIAPTDLTTYAAGSASLVAVACIAALVPTLRAVRVSPAVTMRAD